MRVPAFAILISCLASAALADDFKTTEGKEYKNATLFCLEPDGIDIKTKSGISKIYFSELPQQVQERFYHGSQWSAQQPARRVGNFTILFGNSASAMQTSIT